MFFMIERHEVLVLPPKALAKNYEERIFKTLRENVEGKCMGRYGYVIMVIKLIDVGQGKINEDTGNTHFQVGYLALVYRPFKNEIVNAVITAVTESGFFCKAGPQEIWVSKQCISGDYVFDPETPKFYVKSKQDQAMKDEGEEGEGGEEDGDEYALEKDVKVRVLLRGVNIGAEQITAIGAINEDYLGNC